MFDRFWTPYQSPTGQTPTVYGTPVTVFTPNGPVPGYWDNGTAQKY